MIFGIYRPVMELLGDPKKNFRTHFPKLYPYLLGYLLGFLGVANVLAFFLNRYPDPSVCLFIGLIMRNAALALGRSRKRGTFQRILSFLFLCGHLYFYAADRSAALRHHHRSGFQMVSVLRLLSRVKHYCTRHELFYAPYAARTLYLHSLTESDTYPLPFSSPVESVPELPFSSSPASSIPYSKSITLLPFTPLSELLWPQPP